MHEILKMLCMEVLSGDIGSQRFNELWVASGIPLEEDVLDVANQILNRAAEYTPETLLTTNYFH